MLECALEPSRTPATLTSQHAVPSAHGTRLPAACVGHDQQTALPHTSRLSPPRAPGRGQVHRMASGDEPKGAVPEEAPCPPGAVVLDVFGEDGSPGKWEGRHGSVVFEPPAGERWREFLRITAVQQTLVLFLGSLAYDAGSIACVPPLACGLFVGRCDSMCC